MDIKIEKATKNDALNLSILIGRLLQEIMDKINIKVFNFNQEETEKRAIYLISKNLYFVFIAKEKHTNKAIGFISLYESYALYAEGAYGTIPELYVCPKYRSKKIGKLLLAKAREFASSKNWKRLEVTTPPLPEFDKTLTFYETNNFEIAGGRKLKSNIET